jgi:hypothetical protein
VDPHGADEAAGDNTEDADEVEGAGVDEVIEYYEPAMGLTS